MSSWRTENGMRISEQLTVAGRPHSAVRCAPAAPVLQYGVLPRPSSCSMVCFCEAVVASCLPCAASLWAVPQWHGPLLFPLLLDVGPKSGAFLQLLVCLADIQNCKSVRPFMIEPRVSLQKTLTFINHKFYFLGEKPNWYLKPELQGVSDLFCYLSKGMFLLSPPFPLGLTLHCSVAPGLAFFP